ncbi:hypothetical protein D3C78_1939750 [compost metagenome]
MNSLIYMHMAMKKQEEQKRVIREQKPKPRVLTGGCQLYHLQRARAGDQGDVQA